jgi:hypothetical protein
VRHAAHTGKKKNTHRNGVRKPEGRKPLEGLSLDGRIIVRRI